MITVASSLELTGKAGEALAEPFVVQVTDEDGVPLPGAPVLWRVASGAGRFRDADTERVLEAPRTLAGASGLARVLFEPITLGTSTVQAVLPNRPDRWATFTAEATSVVIHVSWWIMGPDGESSVTVPVGTTVEWLNWWDEARITSTSAPANGGDFDSGILGRRQRFSFTPPVPGTWKYIDSFTKLTGSITAVQK